MYNREKLFSLGNSVSEKFSDSKSKKNKLKESNQKFNNNVDLDQNEFATSISMLEKANKYFLPVYSPDLIIVRGKDSKVWDSNGNEFIDFGSGISVNNLGHNNYELKLAMMEQADKIWHTSNLFLTEPSIKLAEILTQSTFADRVFFCNSGAEANEAAIKIARKHSSLFCSIEKREIITFEGSFHGRTIATMTATAKTKYQQGFEPLPKGFRYCPFNDFEKASEMIGANTCAVMIEPIQGEGGIIPTEPGFLKHLRELCDKHNALLIFDEVQCGMGRTGKLFAYEWENIDLNKSVITPDILTIAKSLGGGLPIGAMLCKEKIGQSFKPGDHGSTFGGNPIVTSVALSVLKKVNTKKMLSQIIDKGTIIMNNLHTLNEKLNLFESIRGRGMMIGAVLTKDWNDRASEMITECRKKGLLILVAGPNVLRFLPPLNISYEEIEDGMKRLNLALTALHVHEHTRKNRS